MEEEREPRRGTVIDRYAGPVELDVPVEQYHRIPRNDFYKYEYFGDRAVLSPRPKPRHVRIRTDAPVPTAELTASGRELRLRPLSDDDLGAGRARLARLFAAAFHRTSPFAALDDERRRVAATEALDDTFGGREGPLMPDACRVAVDAEDRALGASLVTLPDAPLDVHESMRGVPHLTWIFVAPMLARDGIGTAMLGAALAALRAGGHGTLNSTFLVGNDASALWHWECGFELLANPYSVRRAVAGDPIASK